MKSLLGALKKKITSALDWVRTKLSPARRKAVLEVADRVHDLMTFALPAMKVVAKFTRDNEADDRLVEALERMNRRAAEFLVDDEDVRDGLILALAVEVTKSYVADALSAAAGRGIKIGNMTIQVPSDLSKSWLRAAVDYAYGVIFKPSEA